MTIEEIEEMAQVMMAYVQQKPIESRTKNSNNWYDSTHPTWDFERYRYRIKKEPWSKVLWVHDDGRFLYHVPSDDADYYHSKGFRKIEVKEVKS
jgi:hypothetical protein